MFACQDSQDSNQQGLPENGFSTGFDHSNEVTETDTHGHDNKNLESCLRGAKEAVLTPKDGS